ncbi:hypothetical protein [Halorhabdus amylolytica]|uniref:hypothetical protein n=1 Tax=Halorhabdus amylolytica TaxID=2559573 RepID=UPI0010AA18C3|nr:hypothetical protein [Halorhabdus amylolytica]
MSKGRAEFGCPSCGSSSVFYTDPENVECRECGVEVYEPLAENAGDLEDLAETELPVAELADMLLEEVTPE